MISVVLCALLVGVETGDGVRTKGTVEPRRPPTPTAAVVTPDAVVVHFTDGTRRSLPDTAGARGVAFDHDNRGVYVAGPHALRHVFLNGQRVRLLTADWEMISAPAVSPDGRSVAFAGYTRAAKWSIYTLTGRNANPRFVAQGFRPAWLPDGRTLLFENYTDESAQIYRHDPETRDVSRVSLDDAGPMFTAVSVAVSGDGRWLSFSSRGALFLKDRRGGPVRPLTDGRFYDDRQTFSPDASRLLFIRQTRDPKRGPHRPRAMQLTLETRQVTPFGNGPALDVAYAHASQR